MKTIFITILCVLMIGCKSKDKGVPKLGYMSPIVSAAIL